jgi:hypothetical protein
MRGQYCTAFDQCDCNAEGWFPGDTGYVTLNNVYTEDLFGNYITKTNTNEVLFDQIFLNAPGWNKVKDPGQASWTPATWNSANTFPDYYSFCTNAPTAFSPPPTSSGSGGALVFTETQNYYIGGLPVGTGLCTQASAANLYTNHGAQSNIQPPAYPATLCASRAVLNTAP